MCTSQLERLKLPQTLMMVALEILKKGFVPGQGLGVNLDEILDPIQLSGQKSTFGLGYEPTPEEVSSANLKGKSDIILPKIVPLLNQLFYKAFVAQVTEKDAEEDLMEGVMNLFITEEEAECNVILEDCIETLTIWDTEPRDISNNWTCTPSPILWESCKQTNKSVNTMNVTWYNQILMNEEDFGKIAFIIPYGVYYYRVMPFGLKNAGETYMRAMTTSFHYMIHKEIKFYVDDVIIKSRKSLDDLEDLKKFFNRLR
ncbi:hypothetical protein CQW23_21977 [Capsicum baccatum]|uniref:G-patch domain-containing protein n=1 Tax=Capsicum baccatum TaxID=33114 RepID=A0A2G2VZJ0_CAPBA|nr:hypothetical protein CQW23_21977 [Capsicum baccatum]